MPDPLTAQELDEIEARANAAIDGPWNVDETRDGRRNQVVEPAARDVVTDCGRMIASLHITVWKQGMRDARPTARFIASARTDVPRLVAEVRRLQAELEAKK